jgi:O-acetyl-ADP-ribose deacetylase (regulator of RNase III)
MSQEFLNGRVLVGVGDITAQDVDAIVNAANSSLLGGGGVDGAIHRVGGPAILAACREIRRSKYPAGLPAGDAVITTGGALKARFVIHTVGPIWGHDSHPEQKLASCYRRCLEIATANQLDEIAFPAISTGAYGFPKERAAVIASQTLRDSLLALPMIERVHLVFFDIRDAQLFAHHQQFG